MVAGVFAGDPEALSLAAAFPRMAELEREHGSLFRAMAKLGGGGAPRGHLTTLRDGRGSARGAHGRATRTSACDSAAP
jgi:oxygen-dependent protoporphyrinogen oxidase